MRYVDSATGKVYDKGPGDFLTDGNTRYIATGNGKATQAQENPFFDEELYKREWAEWEKYKASVDGDNDEGSKDVANYPGIEGDPPVSDGKVDFDKVDNGDINLNIAHAPDVPKYGDGSGGGTIAISTDAMKNFRENILMLKAPIDDSVRDLGKINVEPGGFAEAWAVEQKIEGQEGLVPATSVFIGKVRNNLLLLAEACDALMNEYNGTEELNTLKGDKLNGFVGQLGQGIKGMGGSAPPA